MSEHELPEEDLGDLAEKAMNDKREESGDEAETRELFDVPSVAPGDLAKEQSEKG